MALGIPTHKSMLVKWSFWIEFSNKILAFKERKLGKYVNMLVLWKGNTWYIKLSEIQITKSTNFSEYLIWTGTYDSNINKMLYGNTWHLKADLSF